RLAVAPRIDLEHLVVGDLEILGALVGLVDEHRALFRRHVLGGHREPLPAHAFVVGANRVGERVARLGRGTAGEQHEPDRFHDSPPPGARFLRTALIASRSRLPSSPVATSATRNESATIAHSTRVISLPCSGKNRPTTTATPAASPIR